MAIQPPGPPETISATVITFPPWSDPVPWKSRRIEASLIDYLTVPATAICDARPLVPKQLPCRRGSDSVTRTAATRSDFNLKLVTVVTVAAAAVRVTAARARLDEKIMIECRNLRPDRVRR